MESGLAGPWVESRQAEPESKECRSIVVAMVWLPPKPRAQEAVFLVEYCIYQKGALLPKR